ncbi:MAG TPA: PilW family protein [Steroidobacteraceae bacterium]|nr:PilW family protein [Steroidobacteraceae bacterium]
MNAKHWKNRSLPGERGFTLLEILIALTIGLFLLGALLIIVQTNKTVFGNQNQLSQLQDGERMALMMMSDVIQSAGYFPDPTVNTQTSTLTAVAPFGSGESISGTFSAAPPGDTISVRYMTAGGDGILNCSGQSNPLGGPNTLFVNSFQVVAGQLVCTMNTVPYNLVNGVTSLNLLYGVKTSVATVANDVDTYMDAQQVTAAALWGSVITVMVRLTFANPLYVAANPQGQSPTVTIQRVVGVMNRTGPMQ